MNKIIWIIAGILSAVFIMKYLFRWIFKTDAPKPLSFMEQNSSFLYDD